jgi:hypothetical protein
MKRPQFGIRTLLLTLALLAVCFAWRQAIRDRERADRESEITNLQTQIAVQQQYRADYAKLNPPKPSNSDSRAIDSVSPQIEHDLEVLQERLRALKE